MNDGVLLQADGLCVDYPGGKRAVDRVGFHISAGERVGLVGESGSGKSSLARALLGLEPIAEGKLHFPGFGNETFTRRQRARFAQMVFQDPYHSLNPRRTIRQTLEEALLVRENDGIAPETLAGKAAALLESVHLDPTGLDRYPHGFSGGQRQRICIARALAPSPRLLVCDEAVSALDVTTQRSIIELLRELGERSGVALLFITHDLPLVETLCSRVLVMDGGTIVEEGPVEEVFKAPRSEKSKQLLDSVLRPPPAR